MIENNTTLNELMIRASHNAEELVKLKSEMKALLESEELEVAVKKVDKTFVKKITFFPGDITSHRIAKTLSKVLA